MTRHVLFTRISCIAMSLAVAAPLPAATSAWIRNPQSAVRLVTPCAAAARSGDLRLGVQFTLAPGWHAYWRNPGSAGFPPTFESGTSALRILETRWPAPSRFDLPGGLVAFGYSDEVLYPLRTHLDAPGSQVRLVVDVDYLVCEVDCVPYRYDLTLDQPLADTPAADPEGEAAVAEWEARVPAPIDALQGFLAEGSIAWQDEAHGTLRLAFPRAAGRPELFLESHDLLELEAPRRDGDGGGVSFQVPVTRKATGRALPLASDLAWTLVGLDGAPRNVAGRTSVAVREPTGVDWRWLAAGAGLVVLVVLAFLARRRPPAAAANL